MNVTLNLKKVCKPAEPADIINICLHWVFMSLSNIQLTHPMRTCATFPCFPIYLRIFRLNVVDKILRIFRHTNATHCLFIFSHRLPGHFYSPSRQFITAPRIFPFLFHDREQIFRLFGNLHAHCVWKSINFDFIYSRAYRIWYYK